jgi:glc operon protein GlcG
MPTAHTALTLAALSFGAALSSALPLPVLAQQQVPEQMPFDIPYGQPISLSQAQKLATAAMNEAEKHHWKMAVAVVEPSGSLVTFSRMDGTQYASIRIAQDKARAAAGYRRPTKAFSDAISGGAVGLLSLAGVTASEGGIPLVENGKLIGAIGVSGGLSVQDGVAAKAGVDALGH